MHQRGLNMEGTVYMSNDRHGGLISQEQGQGNHLQWPNPERLCFPKYSIIFLAFRHWVPLA